MSEMTRIIPDAAAAFLQETAPMTKDHQKLTEAGQRYYQALLRLQGKEFPRCPGLLNVPWRHVCLLVEPDTLVGLSDCRIVMIRLGWVETTRETAEEVRAPEEPGASKIDELVEVKVLTPHVDGYICRQVAQATQENPKGPDQIEVQNSDVVQ